MTETPNEDRNDCQVVKDMQLLEIQTPWLKFIGSLGKIWGLVQSVVKCLSGSVANDFLEGSPCLVTLVFSGGRETEGREGETPCISGVPGSSVFSWPFSVISV